MRKNAAPKRPVVKDPVYKSEIVTQLVNKVLRDGKIIDSESGDVVIDDTDFTRGFMIDKIDGVDHTDSAHFSVTDFYVFYEKAAPED